MNNLKKYTVEINRQSLKNRKNHLCVVNREEMTEEIVDSEFYESAAKVIYKIIRI